MTKIINNQKKKSKKKRKNHQKKSKINGSHQKDFLVKSFVDADVILISH